MDQKPRRRDKTKTTKNSFDKFYFEYCERALGSVRQTNQFSIYVGVLYNLYKLTTDDKTPMDVREFCNNLAAHKHQLFKTHKGQLCVKRILLKPEHKKLLVQAIKATNAYEKEQGNNYDYGRALRAQTRNVVKEAKKS